MSLMVTILLFMRSDLSFFMIFFLSAHYSSFFSLPRVLGKIVQLLRAFKEHEVSFVH